MVGHDNVIHSLAALYHQWLLLFFGNDLEKSKTRFNYIITSLFVGLVVMFIPMIINLLSYIGNHALSRNFYGWNVVIAFSILSVALYTLFLPILERIFKISTTFRMAELTSLANLF